MLKAIDKKTKIHSLILLFWAFFWLLNGGDKFFNGEFTHVDMPGVTKAVIVNADMDKVYEIKGVEAIGWYGVNQILMEGPVIWVNQILMEDPVTLILKIPLHGLIRFLWKTPLPLYSYGRSRYPLFVLGYGRPGYPLWKVPLPFILMEGPVTLLWKVPLPFRKDDTCSG